MGTSIICQAVSNLKKNKLSQGFSLGSATGLQEISHAAALVNDRPEGGKRAKWHAKAGYVEK
ncbi:hypothetical protein ANO14919_095480 [Xylariales sp. No.14919]|nr:hypothetical protein ANO14919_095480 [Xylariales sp. No.14919]